MSPRRTRARRTGREARHASTVLPAAATVELVRGSLGVLHLVTAQARRDDPLRPRRGGRTFDRVLGVRQLVEAVLLRRSGTGDAHTLAAAVDLTHAVSMLPLLFVGARWRRLGASQLVIALGLAVAEVLLVGARRRR